jgi:hypothetical protein
MESRCFSGSAASNTSLRLPRAACWRASSSLRLTGARLNRRIRSRLRQHLDDIGTVCVAANISGVCPHAVSRALGIGLVLEQFLDRFGTSR